MNQPSPSKFPPVNPRFPYFLHGGDYNPEQWINTPEVWDQDVQLMHKAHCNAVSIGIFSWAMLETSEGHFDFSWLDKVIEKLTAGKIGFILATPTGAKPNWMAAKYPEIRRCGPNGQRESQGGRHNHCYTSPVYREKATIINTKLAERYGTHPGLIMWHISNEYGGECYCPLCKAAFREWLKRKFKTLEALNSSYWTRFWSHAYSDWEQIDQIDGSVHGLALDWKRFVTEQTVDFMRHETVPLKKITPNIPVTINMMGFYPGLNYWRFAPYVDVISWDSYPAWHAQEPVADMAADTAMSHDMNRALKAKPFILMESTPSQTNWTAVSPLQRPGMHRLASLQAVAHGSDSVLYFQWRKGRGSCEKFHGAVVDHVGHENTRVFRDVAEVGAELERMSEIIGATTPAQVGLIYDWENRWMIDMEQGPRNTNKDYQQAVALHYRPFWKAGVPVDVIDMEQDFSKYRLLVAPMLYMLRPTVAERIERFVAEGGTFVTTYFSGYVNENDTCFQGGFPGPLRKLLGIWDEELDVLGDHAQQTIVPAAGNELGLAGNYSARHYSELIHAEGARVVATYGSDFYAGRPAVTINDFGKGKAIYVASRNEDRFIQDLIHSLIGSLRLTKAIDGPLPKNVTATYRTDGSKKWVFLMNFGAEPATIETQKERIDLPPWGFRIVSG